ncbi:hypothetical protein [Nesterenkonia sp. CF4.4]|uniref:hypothetical protein n=1 Tax=Nesterenkonia sp. CF4.4 TaxID=3373079 RepID=UPI003EE77738
MGTETKRRSSGSIGESWGAALAVVALSASLAGCSSSPETTIVDDSGDERTISWSDYPAHANTDAQSILSAPRPEHAENREQRIFTEIETVLSEEYGFDWMTEGEPGWFEQEGNGYGGESYLMTYNSVGRMSDGVPTGPGAWRDVLTQIDEVLTDYGLEGLELHHASSSRPDEEQWRDELFEKYGTTDPDEYWQWAATSSNNSEWVSVTLTDVAKDPSGDAADVRADVNLPGQSVSISYGVTTVPADVEDDYRQALESFEGLPKPEPTTSD